MTIDKAIEAYLREALKDFGASSWKACQFGRWINARSMWRVWNPAWGT